ncbi:hypothetical protein A3H40_02085 [Candidatus Daviesbacteria bacterium RIFCSPLOWO2_02_FULL_38_15]|uniref:Uncharacterized protein n=1 Tax=Candidatus Daviesbacteria bacterium RIFCSPLOWO2_02_FULL_38_15 TaxID=1797794 RepID=A0A1F5N3C5_9BACT|nr:MAG: hypothetical protein A3H40_02085 [Candidatus Daviesbacteria bacterium RIFCSPLOWO2_02_FULL_38_15]
MNDNGRPEYTDEQYQIWLDELVPFLKLGNTLYHAMEKAGLLQHKDSIYRKSRLKDWFCEKIEAYKRYPGEIVNSIFVRLIAIIDEKVKQGIPLSDENYRNLRWFAEKHRSCQLFFINKHEITQTPAYDPERIKQLLDELEEGNEMIDDVAEHAALSLALDRGRELEKQGINLDKLPPPEDPVQT